MDVKKQDRLRWEELENLVMLTGVELGSIRGLLEDCPVTELEIGDILIHAERPNEYLYLVLSGRFRVHLELDKDAIAVIRPGECVGELSLIDGELTTAYVVADTSSRVLVMDEGKMWSLIDASPVARNLLFMLTRRLRHGDALLLASQKLRDEYARHAITDPLTGLYNRRWLDKALSRQMERSKTGQKVLCILLADIDGFKDYNDRFGHVFGDRALYHVARVMQDNMRPGEMIARYGGDEFLVLLPEVDGLSARKVAERLRRGVETAKIPGVEAEKPSAITISVGLAEMLAEDTTETFIGAADAALARAKAQGGNQVAEAERNN